MLKLPTSTQHIAVIGRNGSGKTVAALWHLSLQNINTQPWIILDYKLDENIDRIPGLRHLDGYKEIPRKPGIYAMHPRPGEKEEIDEYLWKVWERERTGIYIDEGYMVDGPAFEACLTQGRSKRIPMIVLSQRPSWISRFVFSESRFYQVFSLSDMRDRKTVGEFVPGYAKLPPLPEYHSHYYDVDSNRLSVLKPVPDVDSIMERIGARTGARPNRVWL